MAAVVVTEAAATPRRVCGLGCTGSGELLAKLWSGCESEPSEMHPFEALSFVQVLGFVNDFARATSAKVVVSIPDAPHILVSTFVEPVGVLAPVGNLDMSLLCAISHRIVCLFAKTPISDDCLSCGCLHPPTERICRETMLQYAARHELATALAESRLGRNADIRETVVLGEVAQISFSPWQLQGSGVALYRADGSPVGMACTRANAFGTKLWEFLLACESRTKDLAFFVEYEQRQLNLRLSLTLYLSAFKLFSTLSDSAHTTWERRPRYIPACTNTEGLKYVTSDVSAKNFARSFFSPAATWFLHSALLLP